MLFVVVRVISTARDGLLRLLGVQDVYTTALNAKSVRELCWYIKGCSHTPAMAFFRAYIFVNDFTQPVVVLRDRSKFYTT